MKPRSVLVVEDQQHSRELLGEFISRCGYNVTLAADGEQALSLLKNELRPGLILLDLHLPGMNGWQLQGALMDDPKLVDIPVVVTSAAGSQTPPPIGPRAVLPKPIDLRALVRVLEQYCGPPETDSGGPAA